MEMLYIGLYDVASKIVYNVNIICFGMNLKCIDIDNNNAI